MNWNNSQNRRFIKIKKFYPGLDPPSTSNRTALGKDAASNVDIIHTSVLGTSKPMGHADFYVNGGKRQPGCKTANGIVRSSRDKQMKKSGLKVCPHLFQLAAATEEVYSCIIILSIQKLYTGLFLAKTKAILTMVNAKRN